MRIGVTTFRGARPTIEVLSIDDQFVQVQVTIVNKTYRALSATRCLTINPQGGLGDRELLDATTGSRIPFDDERLTGDSATAAAYIGRQRCEPATGP